MTKLLIALLVFLFLVMVLLLFSIVMLTLALLTFSRKGKKGRTLRPKVKES